MLTAISNSAKPTEVSPSLEQVQTQELFFSGSLASHVLFGSLDASVIVISVHLLNRYLQDVAFQCLYSLFNDANMFLALDMTVSIGHISGFGFHFVLFLKSDNIGF